MASIDLTEREAHILRRLVETMYSAFENDSIAAPTLGERREQNELLKKLKSTCFKAWKEEEAQDDQKNER